MKTQHFHTKRLCQKPILRQMECGVQNSPITKNEVDYFFFRKFCFSFRTSYKELIWCNNHPNVHTFILFESVRGIFKGAFSLWVSLGWSTINLQNNVKQVKVGFGSWFFNYHVPSNNCPSNNVCNPSNPLVKPRLTVYYSQCYI